MDQSGAPLAVSLSCDINTSKNQSDCTNCLKCIRNSFIVPPQYNKGFNGVERDFTAVYDNGKTASQVWMGPFQPGVLLYHPDTVKPMFASMGG